jgi:hypothetical protein
MSALTSKADIDRSGRHVRFVPIADISTSSISQYYAIFLARTRDCATTDVFRTFNSEMYFTL